MEHTANMTFQIYHNQELDFQLEEGAAILFGLNGCSQVFTDEKSYELARTGILVINPMELYQLTCPNDAAVLRFHIDKAILNTAGWQRTKYCACYERDNRTEDDRMLRVRCFLAEMFQEYLQNRTASTEYQSPLMKLLHLLQEQFVLLDRTQTQREATMKRIKHILDTIHEQWNEDISLSGIAKQEYLSVSYLSRFFQKNLNMSFSQYMKHLRLIHAAQMLTQTDESITRISYDCGFKSPSSFIETFKQRYQQTPGQFREAKQELRKLQATGLPLTTRLGAAFRNNYFIMLTLTMIAVSLYQNVNGTCTTYYAQYVLGNVEVMGILQTAEKIPWIIGVIILAPFIKKFGKRNLVLAGAVLNVAAMVMVQFAPTSYPVLIAAAIMRGAGEAPFYGCIFTMIADAI